MTSAIFSSRILKSTITKSPSIVAMTSNVLPAATPRTGWPTAGVSPAAIPRTTWLTVGVSRSVGHCISPLYGLKPEFKLIAVKFASFHSLNNGAHGFSVGLDFLSAAASMTGNILPAAAQGSRCLTSRPPHSAGHGIFPVYGQQGAVMFTRFEKENGNSGGGNGENIEFEETKLERFKRFLKRFVLYLRRKIVDNDLSKNGRYIIPPKISITESIGFMCYRIPMGGFDRSEISKPFVRGRKMTLVATRAPNPDGGTGDVVKAEIDLPVPYGEFSEKDFEAELKNGELIIKLFNYRNKKFELN